MGKRTLAPMLKTRTSIAPISRSIRSTSATTSLFDPRVEPECVSLAAFGADRLGQLVHRVGMARPPRHADAKALPREGARDRGPSPSPAPITRQTPRGGAGPLTAHISA